MPRKGEVLKHTDGSCTAKTRDGDLCKNPPMLGAKTCRMHGSATAAAREKAQERIALAAPYAARKIEELAKDAENESVQLRAAQDILDRNQIGTQKQVAVEVRPLFEQDLEGILIDIPEPDVVKGEVVSKSSARVSPFGRTRS